MKDSSSRPPRPTRGEPREVAELRQIKIDHPELAEAVDLQIELLQLQRRIQARIPLPLIEIDPAWLKRQHEQGRPFLRFEEIPLDWTELRLMFRQTADILLRHQAIEQKDHQDLQRIARAGHMLEPLVVRWYAAAAQVDPAGSRPDDPSPAAPGGAPPLRAPVVAVNLEALDQVLSLAMRPFLERCAESIQQRADLTTWHEPYCPLCGGEVEFALITPSADRLLICSRCAARWQFDPLTCPFCRNADRSRITSFASRDGQYRLYACDVCQRYLKAYDGRAARRPLMLAADTIAALPLDAAAMKKGYRG
ncbi:MAG: formate dehydrogenase accessory protein FdhE [Acidobacteria bacterium]|nr:formate dehydrogenase accessory protein FdhE [Acidobacteriota bacterium]